MAELLPAAAETTPVDDGRDTRLTLTFLWIWVLFNYVYGDILQVFTIFMRPALQLQLEGGTMNGIPLNDTATFAMAGIMELSIAMTFLSWRLPRKLNRVCNIVLGIFFTLVMGAILFGSGRLPPLSGYTLVGLIEMATTLAIACTAWRWRPMHLPSARKQAA